MNVLTLIKAVCYQMNLPAPIGIVASTDPGELQLKALYEDVGRDLVSRGCWEQLKRTHTITFTASDDKYAFPTDYYTMLPATQWDDTNKWRLDVIGDIDYNSQKYGNGVTVGRKKYRIFGRPSEDQIQVIPTPSAADTISFDYLSNLWIRPTGATPTYLEALAADTDSSVFDDQLMILGLKKEYCKAKGWDYSAYEISFERLVSVAKARWNGTKILDSCGSGGMGFYPRTSEGSWH